MKKLHISIGEYESLEIEFEGDLQEANTLYQEVKQTFGNNEGLNVQEWARVRNNYFNTGEIDTEDWNRLSKYQRAVINEVKLALRAEK